MATLRALPGRLDIECRPDDPLSLALAFDPAGTLTGQTVTAAVTSGRDGSTVAFSVSKSGDTATLSLTDVQTAALGQGRHSWTCSLNGQVMVAGAFLLTLSAQSSTGTTVTVTINQTTTATVTVLGAPGSGGGGGGAVDSVNGYTGTVVLGATDVGAQPVDSDLTAIAALSTTTFGRALLTLADAAAGRTTLGLGTAATAASGDFQPVDSDLTAIAALSTTTYGRSLLTQADASAARTTLGLGTAATTASSAYEPSGSVFTAISALSTVYQPLDSDLTAIAALTTTTFGRSLLTQADAAAARSTLGLGSLATASTITSADITDGTIVNADISATAAIATSKISGLATVATSGSAADLTGTLAAARIADGSLALAKLATDPLARANHTGTQSETTVTPVRNTFSDTATTVTSAMRYVAQTGTLTASRAVTLPAASAVSAGTVIVVADESGTVTATNTLVITRAGSDTINGGTTSTINRAYGWRALVSDGTSKWTDLGRVGVGAIDATGTPSSSTQLRGDGAWAEDVPQTVNAQTGTTYTLVLADAGRLVTCSNASAVSVTVPPNSSVAFPTGTRIDVAGIGVGIVTLVQGSGVTVNATPSLVFRARYSGATLIKTGTDTWLAWGDFA